MPGGGVPESIGFVENALGSIRLKKPSDWLDKAGEWR